MKTIGRIAALAMTLALAGVLTACGGGASSSAASSSASASSASAAASSASAATSSASAATSSASASASSEAPDVYTNEAFGLRFYLPDGWKFTDAESLKSMNSVVTSAAGSENLDMVAVSSDGKTSVLIGIIEPSDATKGKTAQDILKAQADELTKALEGSNYAFESKEAEVTFDGLDRTLPANITTMTVEGTTIAIGQAVAEKDGYFLDIVAAGSSEDDVLNAFKAFKALS